MTFKYKPAQVHLHYDGDIFGDFIQQPHPVYSGNRDACRKSIHLVCFPFWHHYGVTAGGGKCVCNLAGLLVHGHHTVRGKETYHRISWNWMAAGRNHEAVVSVASVVDDVFALGLGLEKRQGPLAA